MPSAIYPNQVELYMESKRKGVSQQTASAKAGISTRTARRIESGTHCPNRGRPHDWQTRRDPLNGLWEKELQPMLEAEPRLEATTLFETLQENHPGQYDDKLRTVQRRTAKWKAAHGKPKEVMFKINHDPGVMGLSDFTHLKGLSITIAGQPFHHILYHYRLAFSGWQYVQVIQGGESFIGLSQGLQNALFASGGVPQTHRTDSLSAAYRNTGGRNPKLTQLYANVCNHYRIQPTRNNTGVAHENGAIEGSHGYFKRRLCQALYKRGSFDFESATEYQCFIEQVIAKLNGKCQKKFANEQLSLQALPRYRTPDYEVLSAKVSCYSTINVRCVVYTVPSRLINHRLTLHLYHDRLVGFLGTTQVVELERVHIHGSAKVRRARSINYRHVAESLRRKPGAFVRCQWQADLLPNDQWHTIWETLKTDFDFDKAARLITEALYLAATQDQEAQVAEYLQQQLEQSTLTLARLQNAFELNLTPEQVPTITSVQHDLSSYDELLQGNRGPALPNIDEHPQATATATLPRRVAEHRTSGDSRELVLRSVPLGFGTGGSITQRTKSDHPSAITSAVALRKVLDQF